MANDHPHHPEVPPGFPPPEPDVRPAKAPPEFPTPEPDPGFEPPERVPPGFPTQPDYPEMPEPPDEPWREHQGTISAPNNPVPPVS